MSTWRTLAERPDSDYSSRADYQARSTTRWTMSAAALQNSTVLG
jgi:hypothetical protein